MEAAAPLRSKLAAEAAGTAFLVATVVGSGIMAERLAAGNEALALLCNALATGAVLVAIILALSGVSGAHFNPAVTLFELAGRRTGPREAALYIPVQIAGGCAGAIVANLMFALPAVMVSQKIRSGMPLLFSELVATLGLLIIIRGTSRHHAGMVPVAVGLYITAAYWFTASTSFANPAVTIARTLSDTFAGIRPLDAPGFVAAELAGAAAALGLCGIIWPEGPSQGTSRTS
ncbi:MAG: aquaporin family protein [Deltaproteobacteria bacterium]|nr:aquaporin family protein [Deltaproteobacteria bacterium]